jgi:hypothetical protein
MPALDRKFVGVLVIVAIISTAIGLIIFSRSMETIYTILTYDFPKDPVGRGAFSTSKEINHLTLGLLLDKQVDTVSISFMSLVEADKKLYQITNDDLVGDTLVERASQAGIIPQMMNLTDFPHPHDWKPEEIEVISGNTTYDLVLFDFSNISIWAPKPETNLPVIHGVLFDVYGNFSGYFQGGPGYLGWGRALRSITIRRNSNETKYAMVTKGGQPAGTRPMEEAPRLGMVSERNLQKEDIISIDMALDQSKLALGMYIQIVKIRIDGRTREVFITPILSQ